ncbi:MAG: DUF327 family protein [Spirochaetaceae bacterium]|jgi:uncharacterized protein YaaR (DUF327 family)|nr:DUF327 family protein [Spirochaetaceae bacterium]
MVKLDNFPAARLTDAAFLTPSNTEAKKNSENEKNQRTKKLFSAFVKERLPEIERTQPMAADAPLSVEDALTILLDEVYSSGDALSKRPFPDEIKRYRLTIQNFIRYVLDNAYDIKEDEGIPNKLKAGFNKKLFNRDPDLLKARNKYSTVQIIDQKLDRIAADVMIGQIKQLNLLESIEEINGLLVNLLE